MLKLLKIVSAILMAASLSFFASCSGTGAGDNKFDEQYERLIKRTKSGIRIIDTAFIKERARELIINGSNLQQRQKYAEAILEFLEALKYDSSASIYFAIAYNYKELNKFGPAKDYIIKSLELKPNFLPSLELLGEIYRLSGNYEDAALIYEKIYNLNPNANNKMQLGIIYEMTDKEKALKIFEELMESSEDQILLTHLLIMYEDMNKREEYLKTMEKLYNYSPSNIRLSLLILESYHKKSLYGKLCDFIDKIENNLPIEDFEVCLNFIGSELLADSSEEGSDCIASVINKIDKRFYFETQINMLAGRLSMKIKDSVLADNYMSRALNLADTIPDIPYYIAESFLVNNMPYKALEVIKKYSAQFPDDVRFPWLEARYYESTNNLKESVLAVQRAIEIDSAIFELWAQLGIAYDRMGKPDSSDMAYEKALAINPDNPLINNNYAYSLSVRGIELAKALNMINAALNEEPDNPSYLDTYGWIQYKLGEFEKALKYVSKSIEKGETTGEVYEHLGDIYYKLDDIENARQAWQKALELEPMRSSVIERLNRIK